jgi:hypothetical protein
MKSAERRVYIVCIMCLFSVWNVRGNAEEKPVHINSRRELFVDRHLVDSMKNTSFRLHEPHPLPVAASPLPVFYTTVIKDGDRYRAYYRDYIPGYTGTLKSGNPGEITCYAESADGHEWAFPNLGVVNVRSSRGENVVLHEAPFCHNFTPFLDTRPGVNKAEKYKALAGLHGTGGQVAFVSADGIRWRKLSEKPVITYKPAIRGDFGFDSQNIAFWSEVEQCYVAYFRTYHTRHGLLRTINRTTSTDFLRWTPSVPMQPNLPDEHLYTSQVQPYFRAPHIYVALPTRFTYNRLKGEAASGNIGSTDILFMTSRAGSKHFDRPFKEVYIRPGLDENAWGNRANYTALNVVPTGPAELSIYHKNHRRYVLRTDGFVSLHAGYEAGELITKPLVFTGSRLEVNFSTSVAGRLQVELRDAGGTPIPGFRLEDCPPMVGDAIDRNVNWRNTPDLGALAGKPVRFRFVLQDGDLYSYRIAGGANSKDGESMKKDAIRERCRVTYNQDCTDLFVTVDNEKRMATPSDVDRMVDEVADGGSDLMLINPNSQIGRVNYPNKVWQPF